MCSGWLYFYGLYTHLTTDHTSCSPVQTWMLHDTDTTNSHLISAARKKTWLAHISQPWKTISFVSPSWDCEEWHLIHPEMLRLLIKTQTLQLLRYDLLLSPWVGLLKESRCRHKCFRTCKLLGRENPSHSVCRQINPPLSSLIPSESSVVSYYAVLHTAGRWSNPDTNLVYLKSNLKAFWSQGNTRGDVSLSMTGHWAEVCLETQRVCRFMGKYR